MGEPIRYEDFAISIEKDGEGRLKARVDASPLDRSEGPFTQPDPAMDAEAWFEELEGSVRGFSGATHDDGSWTVETSGAADDQSLAEQRGQELFDALFQEEVRKLWDECRVRMENRQGEGLRLRLVFDRKRLREDFDSVAFLPWELLCDPRGASFLARNAKTPVVRHVVTARDRAPRSFYKGFSVLLVAPRPAGTRPLDQVREAQLVKEALAQLPEVKVVEPEGQTVESLLEAISASVPTVLHFMGHGDFGEGQTEGGLFFEDDEGQPHLVPGSQLAGLLQDLEKPPIVVLNACGTSMLPRLDAKNPYSHVAEKLVAKGFTTVIAMQFSISDQAAIQFTKHFYRALADGLPVDGAVARGRLGIAAQASAAANEWATPTLYMRSADGYVLDRHKLEGDRLVSTRPLAVLGIRTFMHNTEPMETYVPKENILSLTGSFDGRFLREKLTWAGDILPRVTSFLAEGRQRQEEVKLLFDAHLSIAVAAGWHAGLRAGQPITVTQRLPWGGVQELRLDEGRRSESASFEQLWSLEEIKLPKGGQELAIVVSVTHLARSDAEPYLEDVLAGRVGRVLYLAIRPAPAPDGLRGARHALDLAHSLDRLVRASGHDQLTRTKHLFLCAPGSFAYALGAYVRGWGPVQLYEHDLERTQPKAYAPSLLLEPAQLQAPSFGE
ncbi:MAG TPA: CHAT domain-containing protein [Thermoanaerobaculia bacterium]|nr:CHAT domain-containing protein [Thermoanaerobaculia bacterium]